MIGNPRFGGVFLYADFCRFEGVGDRCRMGDGVEMVFYV